MTHETKLWNLQKNTASTEIHAKFSMGCLTLSSV